MKVYNPNQRRTTFEPLPHSLYNLEVEPATSSTTTTKPGCSCGFRNSKHAQITVCRADHVCLVGLQWALNVYTLKQCTFQLQNPSGTDSKRLWATQAICKLCFRCTVPAWHGSCSRQETRRDANFLQWPCNQTAERIHDVSAVVANAPGLRAKQVLLGAPRFVALIVTPWIYCTI